MKNPLNCSMVNLKQSVKVWLNRVDSDEMAHMNHLIWIYTVCFLIFTPFAFSFLFPISFFPFLCFQDLTHLFNTIDSSIISSGRVYLNNLGWKGLNKHVVPLATFFASSNSFMRTSVKSGASALKPNTFDIIPWLTKLL